VSAGCCAICSRLSLPDPPSGQKPDQQEWQHDDANAADDVSE
jgi:hypothetical protein